MVELTYVLNTIVCIVCTVLLWIGWRRGGSQLLMWSAACFLLLSINNALIFVDVLVVPEVDLSILRAATALVGFSVLLFGLIWES
ncbi:MAG: hypothetical protein JWM25_1679 [Thermoleophilia bacterium]|nr:hypothetical protein [Thermoleophilia bacterium]